MLYEEKYAIILGVRTSRLTKKVGTKAARKPSKKQMSMFDMKTDIKSLSAADRKLLKEQLGI